MLFILNEQELHKDNKVKFYNLQIQKDQVLKDTHIYREFFNFFLKKDYIKIF